MAGNKTFPPLQQMPSGSFFHACQCFAVFALDVHFANVVRSRLQCKISNGNV